MEGEKDEPNTQLPQLAENATDEQKTLYAAVLNFYHSDLDELALTQFTKPRMRQYIHDLAESIGMYHRSEGRASGRHVALKKGAPTVASGRFDPSSNSWLPYKYVKGDEESCGASLDAEGTIRCLTFNVLYDPGYGPEEAQLEAQLEALKIASGEASDASTSSTSKEDRKDPTCTEIRREKCFEFLSSRGAHVITLNEVSRDFYDSIILQPWARNYWISEVDTSATQLGNFIMSLFPIRSSYIHQFRFSEKRNNLVEIVLPENKPALWVSTAHLKAGPAHSNGRFRRSQSLEMVSQLKYVSKTDINSIIMGDLNVRSSENEVLNAFEDWTDCWTTLHPNDEGLTYDPWSNDLAKMASERICAIDATRTKVANRYDRILLHGASLAPVEATLLAKESIGTNTNNGERLFISDHYALEAVIKVSDKKSEKY